MRASLWRVGAFGLMVPLLVLLLLLVGCGTAPASQWQTVGPGGAQISTLASDPHIRGIIFAGGADGTTYYARGDRSGQFVSSNKSPGGGPVNVIFPSPYANGVVYVGTVSGFYRSSNYGVDYAPRNSGLPSEASVTAITTGPDASTLFINVAQKGLYSSDDGGKSWKAVAPEAGSGSSAALSAGATVQALFWDATSKSLYATVSGAGAGIYVSRDNGASWRSDSDGLPAKTAVYMLVEMPAGGIAPSGPTLYAGTAAGVFARASASATWQRVGTDLPPGTVYSLAVYSPSPGLLYAGTAQTVYASTDGGQHWKRVADGLAHTVPAIVVVPGQDTPIVAYAAAGQVVRYPASKASDSGFLGTLLVAVLIAAAAWYVLAHYHFVPSIRDVQRRLSRRGKS